MERPVVGRSSLAALELRLLQFDEHEVPWTPTYETHSLIITSWADFLLGTVIGHSANGLDAEIVGSLAKDDMVSVECTVKIDGDWKHCSGAARVAHCEAAEDDLHRVRLEFETSPWVDAAPVPEQPDFLSALLG